MIETGNNNLDKLMERQPFHVPEGYFEGFTENLMSRLPERQMSTDSKVISFYDRLKPWLYIAASFIGLIILINILNNEGVATIEHSNTPNVIASTESGLLEEVEDAELLDCLVSSYTYDNALACIIDDYWDY